MEKSLYTLLHDLLVQARASKVNVPIGDIKEFYLPTGYAEVRGNPSPSSEGKIFIALKDSIGRYCRGIEIDPHGRAVWVHNEALWQPSEETIAKLKDTLRRRNRQIRDLRRQLRKQS